MKEDKRENRKSQERTKEDKRENRKSQERTKENRLTNSQYLKDIGDNGNLKSRKTTKKFIQ
ncbi:hypothetical protein [uncultured Bacteroides sp.]|uniref:hypothetical protein n=1 Tax=uncultured Bacteroides sp. TaxID=162156 RepID=UPI002674EA10|nr:hypothetical protein [uncultured Bacteroides sp.]